MVRSLTLRSDSLRLRIGVLSGIALCLAIAVVSIWRYPSILLPLPGGIVFLSLFGITCGLYLVLTLWGTRNSTSIDGLTLRMGRQWGLIVGALWVVEVIAGNLLDPHQAWVLVAYFGASFLAYLAPILPGFLGARQSGRAATGAQIGGWIGMVSGLITFLTLMALTYVQVLVPAFPYYHNAADYQQFLMSKAPDYVTFIIGDALAGGMVHLLLIGLLLGSLVGWLGGAIGAGFRTKTT